MILSMGNKFIMWNVNFLWWALGFVVVMYAIQKGVLVAIGYALSVVLAMLMVGWVIKFLKWRERTR